MVRHNATDQEWVIGSPGMTIGGMFELTGFDQVQKSPGRHWTRIKVDLPFYIPLENTDLKLPIKDETCVVGLRQRKRGEEAFSSLDTAALPNFTALTIDTGRVVTDPLQFIQEILRSIERLFAAIGSAIPEMHNTTRFSIEVEYYDITTPQRIVARGYWPLTGEYVIPDTTMSVRTEGRIQEALNTVRIELARKASVDQSCVAGEAFFETVFRLLHDLAFYCRQHSRVIHQLAEEELRDLFLIPLKVTFAAAEGECFIFSGRGDIKVTNPQNKYEYGLIEFKNWSGESSVTKLFSQALREHSTGQEAFIAAIVLCNNRDQSSMRETVVRLFRAQPEFDAIDADRPLGPSREWFRCGSVKIRSDPVKFVVGAVNTFYENIRRDGDAR